KFFDSRMVFADRAIVEEHTGAPVFLQDLIHNAKRTLKGRVATRQLKSIQEHDRRLARLRYCAHVADELRGRYDRKGTDSRDHAKSSTEPTTTSPIERPIQSPAIPYPRMKHNKYPAGSPRSQCPMRFTYIGVRVSPVPRSA